MQPTPADPAKDFFEAIANGDRKRIREMLAAEPGLAHTRDKNGATPVLWAVYRKQTDLVAVLLEDRETDFFEACALGRADRVSDLLKAQPEVLNQDSGDGFSGLGLAAYFGHFKTARVLVAMGADVNRAGRRFRVTPLHSAVASRSLAIVELLLQSGAAPDPADAGGTPLHSAAMIGDREIARLLLAAGADLRLKNQAGKTPAELAAESGHTELASELERGGTNGMNP